MPAPWSSRSSACSSLSAERFLAPIRRPAVSRSNRWTSSRGCPGRSARRVSMAPKLMPLPPWLATPVGLFRASRRAYSKTMACSSRRMNASGGPALSPSSVRRTGGARTSSPASSLRSALARPPFTRTCPLRTSL
ncbi:hypothetical protein G6F56_014269 [Rhizopus delemar]|nr:hypothetical protein G6F56_014269 [Rhizopus delemar]